MRQEILQLRRRVEKRAALLGCVALLQTSGFRLSAERLPNEHAKLQILRAVDRARECISLRAVLRFLDVSPSRFQAWRRRQMACALDDESSCPRTSPHRLTLSEIKSNRPICGTLWGEREHPRMEIMLSGGHRSPLSSSIRLDLRSRVACSA
jgi:hypothetical protein